MSDLAHGLNKVCHFFAFKPGLNQVFICIGCIGHRTYIHAMIFLKQKVYNLLPKKLEDLRSNLTREIENIPAQMFKDTFSNYKKGANYLFPRVAVILIKNKNYLYFTSQKIALILL
jgi:hypothetical protein